MRLRNRAHLGQSARNLRGLGMRAGDLHGGLIPVPGLPGDALQCQRPRGDGLGVFTGDSQAHEDRPPVVDQAHDEYFTKLSAALKTQGLLRPTLVIDEERLEKNTATLLSHLPPGMSFRLVVKSLPFLPLGHALSHNTATKRVKLSSPLDGYHRTGIGYYTSAGSRSAESRRIAARNTSGWWCLSQAEM